MKPVIPMIGNRISEVLNDVACTSRDIIKGKTMPPSGIPSFMIPITVPDISGYLRPAKAIISGKITEIVAPDTINRT